MCSNIIKHKYCFQSNDKNLKKKKLILCLKLFLDDIEMEKRERKFVHTRKRKNEKPEIISTNGEQTR